MVHLVRMLFPAMVASVLAGCAAAPVQPVRLDTSGVRPDVNFADLAFILENATDEKGFLDYEALKKHAGRLDAQLKALAVSGPTASPGLYPTPEARLAYWYNARAAWAIKLAFDANCPRGGLARACLEERPFPLDGRRMTLDTIDAVLAGEADWRIPAAAPCVRLHRPRLPRQPFEGNTVLCESHRRFEEFLADRSRFIIDVGSRTILFPPALWALRGRLIGDYDREYRTQGATLNTALLRFVSGLAEFRLQNAIGYAEAPEPPGGPLACLRY